MKYPEYIFGECESRRMIGFEERGIVFLSPVVYKKSWAGWIPTSHEWAFDNKRISDFVGGSSEFRKKWTEQIYQKWMAFEGDFK